VTNFQQKNEGSNTKRYYPKNKEKCNLEYVVCRSTWEEKFARWCDLNSSVITWSSEPFAIPYYDPVKQKERRYFIDFLVKCKTKKNETKVYLIEIKPYKELMLPKKTKGKSKKTMLYEQTTSLTNRAKWKAAMLYCKKRGFEFKIFTEKELFEKGV